MRQQVYTPKQCSGGSLYYEDDLPILALDYDSSPFQAGKAHGYLCGGAINELLKRFDLMLHTLGRRPRAYQLPNALAKIRAQIPAQYLEEMAGVVEGYKEWSKEQRFWRFPKGLTIDDLLLFHLIPDSLHFNPQSFEHMDEELPNLVPSSEFPIEGEGLSNGSVGCSTIIVKGAREPLMVRNMDWYSFGKVGTLSLLVHRKYRNGASTVEVGIPGLIGTITGMNNHRLSAVMNVCSKITTKINGPPACLYNRLCLETCSTVEEVKAFTRKNSPLGAYHLIVTDRAAGASIHFHQSYSIDNNPHLYRTLTPEMSALSTLNCRYNPEPIPGSHIYYGEARQRVINYFLTHRREEPFEMMRQFPPVNGWLTTHSVLMGPYLGLYVAFDNAFAGDAPLHKVPLEKLFT
jgi:hypothetical protein